MTDREKLIELLDDICEKHAPCGMGVVADHLLANGVTFATDTNVPSKWISVEEQEPEQYSIVIVWEPDSCVGEAEWDGHRFRWADDEKLAFATHWMPLPEPPGEDNHE